MPGADGPINTQTENRDSSLAGPGLINDEKRRRDMNGVDIGQVVGILSGGVITIGGILFIWGLIQLGLAVRDGATGGGGQIAGAISMMVGGAIVAAAGLLFGSLDWSWMG
jgi:hypothetical protein